MKPAIAARLIQLNRQFYQTLAGPFSTTRQRLQPGVLRLLEDIPTKARLLDLGCGNGALAGELWRQGQRGVYLGLDSSARLLDEARRNLPEGSRAVFLQRELTQAGWEKGLPETTFDLVMAFAVLHHVPGHDLRRQIAQAAGALLAPGGHLAHSEWVFMNSPRLRARIRPWKTIDLSDDEVEPGDYLLDWRRGGYGLRYVHHFDESELSILADEAGFEVRETFYSDGENSRLGLYQVWERLP